MTETSTTTELTAAEVIAVVRLRSPVSGLFTVTEKVTVAEAPGASDPVQVRSGLAKDTDPALAVASSTSVSRITRLRRLSSAINWAITCQ